MFEHLIIIIISMIFSILSLKSELVLVRNDMRSRHVLFSFPLILIHIDLGIAIASHFVILSLVGLEHVFPFKNLTVWHKLSWFLLLVLLITNIISHSFETIHIFAVDLRLCHLIFILLFLSVHHIRLLFYLLLRDGLGLL